MQAERDYLRHHVFPVLEERLRQRRHHLEPIDLRWGVETRTTGELEQKELLVRKVCLDEINRSRPFLIALIGDRYGWVPPPEWMKAATQEAGYQTEVEGTFGVRWLDAALAQPFFDGQWVGRSTEERSHSDPKAIRKAASSRRTPKGAVHALWLCGYAGSEMLRCSRLADRMAEWHTG